jgi:hypothetical protein
VQVSAFLYGFASHDGVLCMIRSGYYHHSVDK